jgi:hypothetical protein
MTSELPTSQARPSLCAAPGSEALADEIARDIMSAGDGPRTCTRIQFIGGSYNVDEQTQGRFCESALAKCIAKSLRRHLPNDERERWEPAATDAGIGTDLNGWLPSAPRFGSVNSF